MWSRCTCKQGFYHAASPLGCAIAKLPEYGEGTHHCLGGLTPFFIHLHQQCSTWWHRDLSLILCYLHRFFCFWLPPSTPLHFAVHLPYRESLKIVQEWGQGLFLVQRRKALWLEPQRAQEQLGSHSQTRLYCSFLASAFLPLFFLRNLCKACGDLGIFQGLSVSVLQFRPSRSWNRWSSLHMSDLKCHLSHIQGGWPDFTGQGRGCVWDETAPLRPDLINTDPPPPSCCWEHSHWSIPQASLTFGFNAFQIT